MPCTSKCPYSNLRSSVLRPRLRLCMNTSIYLRGASKKEWHTSQNQQKRRPNRPGWEADGDPSSFLDVKDLSNKNYGNVANPGDSPETGARRKSSPEHTFRRALSEGDTPRESIRVDIPLCSKSPASLSTRRNDGLKLLSRENTMIMRRP